MNKNIVVILLIILFFNSVHAVEITELETNPENNLTAPQGITILEIKADVRANHDLIQQLPTEEELDSSFGQLDGKVSGILSSLPVTILAYVIGALILNNLLMFSIFILLKNKGLL